MQNLKLSLFIMINLLFGSFTFGQSETISRYDCKITNYIHNFQTYPVGHYTTDLHQNKIIPPELPIAGYDVAYPKEIRVSLEPEYKAHIVEKANEFWNKMKPNQVSAKFSVTITPLDDTNGSPIRAEYDPLNLWILGSGRGVTFSGAGSKPAKVKVRVEAMPAFFTSNIYAPNYRFDFSFYLNLVKLDNSQGERVGTAEYIPIFRAGTSRPCNVSFYETTVHPAVIDFGNLSKQELLKGGVTHRSFNFILQETHKGLNCGLPFAPKVVFKPLDDYHENKIYLKNGLMMQFKDDQEQYIPMAKPHHLKSLNTNRINNEDRCPISKEQ